MHDSKYALARYVRNIRRGEATNVGLFLQTPHGVAVRFLNEEDNPSNKPRFNDWNIYQEWIAYWRKTVDKYGNSEDLFKELQKGKRGSFFVDEAGTILDEVPAADIWRLAEQLFVELVL